jgi:CRP/FNR family transcriptional regulator, LitR-dependent transcriptional activator
LTFKPPNKKSYPIFVTRAASTPQEAFMTLVANNRPHQIRYRRGQTVYFEGDPALSLFKVETGLVRIAKLTPKGRVLTVRHVLPGDYFGEEAFNGMLRDHQVEALTDATLSSLDPNGINVENLQSVTRSLSDQLQRVMAYEYHLQIGDLRQRVARYLMQLAATPLGGIDEQGHPFVRATHELIAEGTSSTRESVSKIITELRSDHLVQSGYRRITLLNVAILEQLSEATDLDDKD